MEDQRGVHRVRPYEWGAIYLSDAKVDVEFDIDFRDGAGPVYATAAHLAVTVMHPVDAAPGAEDVTLDLRVARARADGMPYEVGFDLPTGRLSIGDADVNDEVELAPGRWLVQFAVDDEEAARRVDIVVSPLPSAR
jgi:hypothetical protein